MDSNGTEDLIDQDRRTICLKCGIPFEWQTDIMLEALCPPCMAIRRIELANRSIKTTKNTIFTLHNDTSLDDQTAGKTYEFKPGTVGN